MPSTTHPWPVELSYPERMAVVRRAIEEHGARLRGCRNVLRLGVGLEHTMDPQKPRHMVAVTHQRHRLHEHDEYVPCIQVTVSGKWPRDRPEPDGSLPPTVPVRVTVEGKEVQIDVPVDVIEHTSPRLHGWDLAASRDMQVANGSAACLVRFGDWKTPMVLSCHHVLALSETQPLNDTDDVTVGYQGAATDSAVSLPKNPLTCDAALAQSPSTVWTPCDQVPALTGILPAGQDPPPVLYALTRDGVRTLTFLQRTGPYTQGGYYGGQAVTFKEVFLATGATTGDTFGKGDSGALLATGSGLLVGMHFAGAGTQSFSAPMSDVFGAFAMSLKLWK